MPELPEVETVRAGLHTLITGKEVADVWFDWPKSFPNDAELVNGFLLHSHITNLRRRAKVLIIDLSTGYSLIVHLKMTGQLVYRRETEHFGAGHPSDSLVGPLPDKSTHVVITFTDGGKLYFNDQRKFGWMKLLPTEDIVNTAFFQKVGPEPLDDTFTWQVMRGRLMRRLHSSIKAALLDQTVIAGIGNIYADESLWMARVHPATPVAALSDAKIKRLHQALVEILRLSIAKGGSTDRNYVNAEGKRGSYLSFAQVFRREGQPCPRCGMTIIKTRVAGRGTHLCPHCQKNPR